MSCVSYGVTYEKILSTYLPLCYLSSVHISIWYFTCWLSVTRWNWQVLCILKKYMYKFKNLPFWNSEKAHYSFVWGNSCSFFNSFQNQLFRLQDFKSIMNNSLVALQCYFRTFFSFFWFWNKLLQSLVNIFHIVSAEFGT